MGYEFFEEKIIFPSAPVLGINNDQSLSQSKLWRLDPSWRLLQRFLYRYFVTQSFMHLEGFP